MQKLNILIIAWLAVALLSGCNLKAKQNREGAAPQQPDTVAINTKATQLPEADCQNEYIKTIALYSFTELGVACCAGDYETVVRLIEQGACTTCCLYDEEYEYDALYTCILFEQPELVEYLISIGVDVNQRYDDNGTSALTMACSTADPQKAYTMAAMLLNAGANVKPWTDNDGNLVTIPVLIALEQENYPLIKLLVDHGADLDIERYGGITAYGIALDSKNERMEKFLMDNYRTNIQLTDNSRMGEYRLRAAYGLSDDPDARKVTYTLTITPEKCIFTGSGYKTDFIYLCDAVQKKDNSIDIIYRSRLAGKVRRAQKHYKVIATLVHENGKDYIKIPIIYKENPETNDWRRIRKQKQ